MAAYACVHLEGEETKPDAEGVGGGEGWRKMTFSWRFFRRSTEIQHGVQPERGVKTWCFCVPGNEDPADKPGFSASRTSVERDVATSNCAAGPQIMGVVTGVQEPCALCNSVPCFFPDRSFRK